MLMIPLSLVVLALSTQTTGANNACSPCPPGCCAAPQQTQAEVAPIPQPVNVTIPAAGSGGCCAPGCCVS